MLSKIRTIVAAVVFVLITLLFLDFTGTLHYWLGWLAKIQFLPAVMALNVVVIVVLVALTLIFGRIYCSVICPLGILQDLLARLRKKKNKYSYSGEVRWLRYPMLLVFIIAGVVGIGSLFQLLAPYSAFGRIATMILQPIWMMGNNVLGTIDERADSYAFYIASATLVVLFILAWRGGRTYCNTICPVGTILSFLARFSFLKIRFDEKKCKNCSLCSKNCKAACIDYKTHTVDYSRCVVCGNCIDSCKFGALKYVGSLGNPRVSSNSRESSNSRISSDPNKSGVSGDSIDTSKRSFLLASVCPKFFGPSSFYPKKTLATDLSVALYKEGAAAGGENELHAAALCGFLVVVGGVPLLR